jgi:hypothetical protein
MCRLFLKPLLAALLSLPVLIVSPPGASAAPPLEFCPHRTPDQQLGAAKGPGTTDIGACIPLVELKDKASREAERTRDVKIENLQDEVTAFLHKYNQFLECCRTDLAELQKVEDLGNEIAELLAAAQAGLFSEHMKIRGWTLRNLLPPVLQARADLKRLHAALEQVATGRKTLEELGYEESAREAARLREIEDALAQDIQSQPLPTGPKTGTGIGVSPSVGAAIGKTPKTGVQIGAEGTADFGVTPRTGRDLGVTGPTGFEIGTTGKAGADIGDSRLNTEQSSVGSSLQPSTVGSSLSDGTGGSSLGLSTIGSSLEDTSVGSSLQQRGTTR